MYFKHLIAAAALAGAATVSAQSNAYGPWHGYPPAGYKEELAPDGYWKIEAASAGRGGVIAIDIAIYRAAELAHAKGHRYVEVHSAVGREDRIGNQEVTLYARASDAPVQPDKCRKGSGRRCYTAEVAAIFRELGGASGREKAVAVPTTDEYGRTVLRSGFGVGAVAR